MIVESGVKSQDAGQDIRASQPALEARAEILVGFCRLWVGTIPTGLVLRERSHVCIRGAGMTFNRTGVVFALLANFFLKDCSM